MHKVYFNSVDPFDLSGCEAYWRNFLNAYESKEEIDDVLFDAGGRFFYDEGDETVIVEKYRRNPVGVDGYFFYHEEDFTIFLLKWA